MAKMRNNAARWSFWERLMGSSLPEVKLTAEGLGSKRISDRFTLGQSEPVAKAKTGSQFVTGHKPSERFMRRPLAARSKASTSERTCLAALAKRVTKMDKDMPLNCEAQFGGYRPGASLPPG